MTDREKVKLGLECCHMAHLDCDNCPYDIENDSNAAAMGRTLYEAAGRSGDWADTYCMICLHQDALELLTPVEPEKLTVLDFGEFTTTVYLCGACRMPIERVDTYCKHCGKKVKWDG